MIKRTLSVLLFALASLPLGQVVQGAPLPNVLWIIVDDIVIACIATVIGRAKVGRWTFFRLI